MLDMARIRPVTASSWDIQSASAIAGDMRIRRAGSHYTPLAARHSL